MKPDTFKRVVLIMTIGILVTLFFYFDLNQYLTIEFLKEKQIALKNFYLNNSAYTIFVYMLVYIVATALSLPGATIITLAGGAIFGLVTGTIVISFASSIGATLAFLASRYLFRDYVQEKFGDKLATINEKIATEGALYLFTLRLVPAFPFFVINLVMGLSPIKTRTFYLVSQAGMLAGTIVFVNAGTQLANPEVFSGGIPANLLLAFALLGIFPLAAKKTVDYLKRKKLYSNYPKPSHYDYNIVVLGAGSAGLVTSLIGSTLKAKVALIEKHKMGGDCLNTGCVPSKALIRSAKMASYAKRAEEFGFRKHDIVFEFRDVMERVHSIIKKIEPHDSIERYTRMGVDCITGEAKIVSPYSVEVNGNIITTKNIVISTGAQPHIPDIPGLDKTDFLTSDTIWEIRELPKKLLVLGGGPIGCELAQAFARLGSNVTQIQRADRIMVREDADVSNHIEERFEKDGITVLTHHLPREIVQENGNTILVCENNGTEVRIEFDKILVAVGRKPNTRGLGLEDLGIELTKKGTIKSNALMQTNYPNIYCAGDVTGPYQFTHTASHQAWYASVNALFGAFKTFRADYRVIPWTTYTDPEVARVGLNETEAKTAGIDYEVTRYDMDDLDRAIADSEDHGFIKVLTKPGTDKILGVTIVGFHAGDIISEYVLAMKHGIGLNKILGTIHIYPTIAEANRFVAGEWKKARKPERLLNFLEKYHRWVRA